MSVVPVKNANRMMAPASLLDNGIELSFADGARGLIPYADVPEVKVRAGISGLELPDPYEMALQTAEGERVEVSWAFARHHCGASYRPTAEAMAAMGSWPGPRASGGLRWCGWRMGSRTPGSGP